jgi:hypothetical protein
MIHEDKYGRQAPMKDAPSSMKMERQDDESGGKENDNVPTVHAIPEKG